MTGAPFVIHGNLDAEAAWAGTTLPARVQQRIALMAALLAALAPPDAARVEVYTCAPVDPARLRAVAGFTPPVMRVGAPPRADLAWAQPDARAANDRRATLRRAAALGVALPGARVIGSLADLDAHLAAGGAAASPTGRWVCKAPWTAAGRDRAHGQGAATGELRARLAHLLARAGELVFEPWLDRVADAGICAQVHPDGRIPVAAPHALRTDARGGFTGIAVGDAGLAEAEAAQLVGVACAVAGELAVAGYRGPLGLDAFAYRDAAGVRRFHPLCEVNARYTFGAVAAALAARTGARTLGFGAAPPGAQLLIAPAPADPLSAWLAA